MPNRNVIASVSPTVERWVSTSRPASPTERRVKGRRNSSDRVSGRRRAHTITTMATRVGKRNTARQGSTAIRPAPTVGAAMGISRNTAMIVAICRAISSPE